jgi:hypothetical protein
LLHVNMPIQNIKLMLDIESKFCIVLVHFENTHQISRIVMLLYSCVLSNGHIVGHC